MTHRALTTTSDHRPIRWAYWDAVHRLAGAQKSARGAPAYSRFVNRPLGRRLAATAFTVGATPNQVTALSGVTTFAGITVLAVAPWTWWSGLVVSALLVLGYALDSADGQLARLRGGGSKAGEWLDHVIDAAKTPALHLGVLVGAYRGGHPSQGSTGWLVVPLLFAVVASTWFFTIILNDHLRRLAGTRDVQATVGAGEARQHSRLRSLASTPADYGVLCVIFLLLSWTPAFAVVYGLMFVGFTLITMASLLKWYREAARLDAPEVAGVGR